MKLTYHEGQNFGDALNPLIFKKLFPDFFDDDDASYSLALDPYWGSRRELSEQNVAFIFPVDCGSAPDPKGDMVCVRGPLTAKALGLPASKAIADGAILIKPLFPLERTETVTPFAYMPHIGSFKFFNDWKGLLVELGIALIDPRDEPMSILQQLQGTGVLLTEAMRDRGGCYGVPDTGCCYDTINAFKWQDFILHGSFLYPTAVPPLFSGFVGLMVKNKMKAWPLPGRIATRSAAYRRHRRGG
ncbi:MAG: hypothetical protein IPI91_15350 [Flavobacteriales bacterium]|nr:hypothetical protein [Flavobacteriales bacterium]